MIIATSWLVGTLVGLGIFPALLLRRGLAWGRIVDGADIARAVALLLMLGILADLFIGLLSGSLTVQKWACWVGLAALVLLLLAGAARVAGRFAPSAQIIESSLHLRRRIGTLSGYTCALVAIVTVSLAISAMPLVDWDARSIWFFHGKVIFFDGGLHPSAFWRNPEYVWSHKDYPPLLPLLAARAADFTLGSWNEFAPKLGLVPLACAGFLGVFVASRSALELGMLLFSTLAVAGSQLWNGYADGWLALEACTAIYALARWADGGEREYLLFGCAALAIALCLKNEAQLLLAVAIPVLLYGGYRQRRHLEKHDALIALVFCPFALWLFRKQQIPAIGELEATHLLKRAFGVMVNWPEMTHRITVLAQSAASGTLLFEAAAAFVLFALLMGLDRISAIVAVAAALYTAGMIMVYFGTPYDFAWQVRYSWDRVLMVPTLLVSAALFRAVRVSLKPGPHFV